MPTDRQPDFHTLAWLRLSHIPTWGPVLIKRAVDALGSPHAVLAAHHTRLALIEGIGPQRAEAFAQNVAATLDIARHELAAAHEKNIHILMRDDPAWPPGLKNIPDPPVVLYVRGRLLPRDALAIGVVGSRVCTLYGREQAERFGALLAGAGITVISGGARGIDTGAHLGALRAKGRTIVVQGCGLNHVYPPENAELYRQIEREGGENGAPNEDGTETEPGSGAIISELPLDVAPDAKNFPPRNRIIAALSLGVLVVEANQRSGSLITARLAADDYGREVFALPGRVDSPASAGTHELIKKGSAHLVENLADILNALGDVGTALTRQEAKKHATASNPAPQNDLFADAPAEAKSEKSSEPVPAIPLTQTQRKILDALANDRGNGMDVDDLCSAAALPAAVVMAELTLLQIRGMVQRAPGNRFLRRPLQKG